MTVDWRCGKVWRGVEDVAPYKATAALKECTEVTLGFKYASLVLSLYVTGSLLSSYVKDVISYSVTAKFVENP